MRILAAALVAILSVPAWAQDPPPPVPPPAPAPRPVPRPEPQPEPAPPQDPTAPAPEPKPTPEPLPATDGPTAPPAADRPADAEAVAPVPSDAPIRLPELVFTPGRRTQDPFDSPTAVRHAKADDLFGRRGGRTVVEGLGDIAGVGIQKTSQGQGSPYVRGFTGFRTLTLLDGLRYNNSIWRDGPNEYVGLVDPWALGEVEVVEGPASVLYGSDALGGVVNLRSRGILDEAPEIPAGAWLLRRRLAYRYGGADLSHSGRGEVSGVFERTFGWRAGGTWREFDDVDGGRHVDIQPNTGYGVRAADGGFEWDLGGDARLRGVVQHLRQDDAWRTHATTSGLAWHGTKVGTDIARVLDHERTFGALHFEAPLRDTFVRDVRVSAMGAHLFEFQDRTRNTGAIERSDLTVATYGAAAQGAVPMGAMRMRLGGDYFRDVVNSGRQDFSGTTGLQTANRIQGVVGDDATYDLAGGFAELDLPLGSWLEVSGGARATLAVLRAAAVQDPVTGLEITVEDAWSNVAGGGRILFKPSSLLRLFAGVSQGFRAPNLSDTTRLDAARSGELEVPSPGLRPERTLTVEGGAKMREGPLTCEGVAFYTWLTDVIDRTPTGNTVNGLLEVQKRNVGDGYVMGASGSVDYTFGEGLIRGVRLGLGGMWTQGAADTYPTSAPVAVRRPLSKVPPATLLARLGYSPKDQPWWIEGHVRASRAQERLSPADERDTERIPVGGTPGYAVFSIRIGAQLAPGLDVHLGLENLGDRDYRYHGSGVNEPGAHAVVGGSWDF